MGSARWGEASYREIGGGGIVGWAATREKALLGFILVRAVADEMEILKSRGRAGTSVDKGVAARLFGPID